MKNLITEKIVEAFAKGGSKVFPIDENTLITPSAKDLARKYNIEFVCSDKISGCIPCNEKDACESVCEEDTQRCCEADSSGKNTYDKKMLVEAVLKALNEKGILDKILD